MKSFSFWQPLTKLQTKFYLGIENAYYKVGQWAVMTGFSRFLWNTSTDFKNCFIKKNFDTNKTQTGRVVTFGKMTSSHQQKKTLFFLSVRRGEFRILPVDQLAQTGVQNIGFVHTSRRFFYYFEFRLETGEFKEKVKKDVFWKGKNRQTWLFLLHAHRSPWRFLRVLLFFSLQKTCQCMMCLSLVTKCVRLKGNELQFFEN